METPNITAEQWRRLKDAFGDVAVENPHMLADLLDMLAKPADDEKDD